MLFFNFYGSWRIFAASTIFFLIRFYPRFHIFQFLECIYFDRLWSYIFNVVQRRPLGPFPLIVFAQDSQQNIIRPLDSDPLTRKLFLCIFVAFAYSFLFCTLHFLKLVHKS